MPGHQADVTEDEPFDFDGPSLRLRGAVCEPKPVQRPHPPILIGGSDDRMLRIVAEHADIWTFPGGPGEAFSQRNAVLAGHCAAIGRDPADIVRSMQIIVRCDEPDAAATARSELLAMIEAGVTHVMLAAILGGRPVRWLGDEIVEPVRAVAPHG